MVSLGLLWIRPHTVRGGDVSLTISELEQVARAFGSAMAMKGYPGFTLEVYLPRPDGTQKETHEVLTHNGTVRLIFHEHFRKV